MFTEMFDTERRIARRYNRLASCTLIQFENHWVGHVINLSSQGVLIKTRHAIALESDQLTVHIELKNGETILLHGEVAHRRRNIIGLNCQAHNPADEAVLAQLVKKTQPPGSY